MVAVSSITSVLLIALLCCAAVIDQRQRRIPNYLSLGAAALGLLCGLLIGGLHGLGQGLLGLGLGFAALLPMYAAGTMGAGDVKLMAAAGSFLGPAETVDALAFTFIAGGVLALVTVFRSDGWRATLSRYAFGIRNLLSVKAWLATRQGPPPAERLRFPYALAILIGVSLALLTPPLFFKGG